MHECKKTHRHNKIAINLCLSRGQPIADKWSRKCGTKIRYRPRMYKLSKNQLSKQRKQLELTKKIANKAMKLLNQNKRQDKQIKSGMKKKESKKDKKLKSAISSILKTNPNLLMKYRNNLPEILGIGGLG